jgi:hypothetical protein
VGLESVDDIEADLRGALGSSTYSASQKA